MSKYVLIGVAIYATFIVTCLFFVVRDLKAKLKDDENALNNYRTKLDILYKRILMLENDVKTNKIAVEHVDSIHGNRQKVIMDVMDVLKSNEETLLGLLKAMASDVDHLAAKVADIQKKSEPQVLITGDTDGDETVDISKPSYKWQYCDNVNREKPIVGETYVVVGRLKGAKSVDVENDNGHYGENGKFYNANGTPFEKVFAYIRMPKASDIQDRLFTLLQNDILTGEVTEAKFADHDSKANSK